MYIPQNPYNGQALSLPAYLNPPQIKQRLDNASNCFEHWRKTQFLTRSNLLSDVASSLKKQKNQLARTMAITMGKPVTQGIAEVEKAAWCAAYFAEQAEHFLKPQSINSDAANSYVCYQPFGVVLGIMPWNFPIWLPFRFLAPSLMAGNCVMVKPDPLVIECNEMIEKIFETSGAPEGLFTHLPIANDQVKPLIEDPVITGISFTGSTQTGRIIAQQAGAALKPSVMELGGSDPFIVMADTNLEVAVENAVFSRIANAGQTCIAAKRILVEEPIYEPFLKLATQKLALLNYGDPLDGATDIGPLAREDLRLLLHQQVSDSILAGARCLLGGKLPTTDGFFYPPTLLADVTQDMRVFTEETFGPVMAVTPFKHFNHAIALANNTAFGLGASLWTDNHDHVLRAIDDIQSGQIAINGMVKTDPRLPSGGIKNSGYGRELGPQGIKDFVNVKQVWIK